MLFYKKKRAAVEIQFNWIFVIVVGAIIILFFVSIIKSQEKVSTENLYINLKEYIDNVFSQAQVDVKTTSTFNLPKIDMVFECNEINIKNSNSNGKGIHYKTVFSPEEIKGDNDLIIYSNLWQMPYPVDYIMYITSNNIRYNIINNDSNLNRIKFIRKIKKALPANITYKSSTDAKMIKFSNYDKERFIFLNQSPAGIELNDELVKMDDSDVTAINIVTLNQDYGKIQYYKKDDDSFELTPTIKSYYLGFPMLIGAIFSEDDLYECNVKKTLLRFKMMTIIYNNRTEFLKSYFPANDSCSIIYNQYNLNNIILSLEKGINITSFNEISDTAKELDRANEDTLIESCPILY